MECESEYCNTELPADRKIAQYYCDGREFCSFNCLLDYEADHEED